MTLVKMAAGCPETPEGRVLEVVVGGVGLCEDSNKGWCRCCCEEVLWGIM